MSPPKSVLTVLVDGVPLPDEEARALWSRFSQWMEDHRGDLAGFAAREGFASVHPTVHGGRPVLTASRTEPQRPYAPASQPSRGAGGSGGRQKRPPADRPAPRNPKK